MRNEKAEIGRLFKMGSDPTWRSYTRNTQHNYQETKRVRSARPEQDKSKPKFTIGTSAALAQEKVRVHHLCIIGLLLAVLVLLDSSLQPASVPIPYRVVDLGTLEQAVSGIVRGPNTAGEIFGGAVVSGSGTRAFLLTTNRFEKLDALPGADWSSSHGINDHGTVVGSSNTATGVRAFLWTRSGGVRDLGALPADSSSEAFGISKNNEVVGYSSGHRGAQAVLWRSDGKIQALGRLLSGDHSRAFAINERGDVVGTSGSSRGSRAFLWTRSEAMQDLGTLPGDTNSEAFGINSRAEVVGHSSGLRGTRAFLWRRGGGMESLGTLPGGDYSRALSINDRGEVVGTSESSLGRRAFLWTRNGGMQDLNAFVPPDNDFVLFEATGVNDRGMILALGRDVDDRGDAHGHHEFPTRVFLLVPTH